MANVSYPRRGRITLTVLTVGAYVAALAGAGWEIGPATLVLRVGMILATAGAADLISVQLTGQLVFRERATAEHEHRASLWSRVAGLGRQLDSLDEDSILAWAVDAVTELGFEAANVCEFLDDGRTYRVVHARGLPDSYVEGVHSSDRGMVALVPDAAPDRGRRRLPRAHRRAPGAARRRVPHRDRHSGVGGRRARRPPWWAGPGSNAASRTTRSPPSSSWPRTPGTASRAPAGSSTNVATRRTSGRSSSRLPTP